MSRSFSTPLLLRSCSIPSLLALSPALVRVCPPPPPPPQVMCLGDNSISPESVVSAKKQLPVQAIFIVVQTVGLLTLPDDY